MQSSRAPDLRLTLRIEDRGSLLTAAPAHGASLAFEGRLTREKLAEQRRLLRDDLELFKRTIGNELSVASWARISSAMQVLHERGRLLAYQLFGARQWGDVQKLVRQVFLRGRRNPEFP